MIKTLRITGVAAVAFAGVVLASVLGPVSLIHLDDRNDQQMGKILAAPGAVERFQELHGDKNQASQNTKPPLVMQAELFKDIIDPKLPTPVAQTQTPVTTIRSTPMAQTAGRFREVHPDRDELFALESECPRLRTLSVDNTFKWVQCGSEVGHLTIKEVREGSVICWDGNRESEVTDGSRAGRVSLLEADDAAASRDPAASPARRGEGQRSRRASRDAGPSGSSSAAGRHAENE